MRQVDWKLAGKRYKRHRFDRSIQNQIAQLRPDNWHGLLALFSDYSVIAICCAMCLGVSWWFYPITMLVIGARQRGLSTILHDSAHGVCARNRTLNKFLGTWLTAYPIFQRYYAYRASHVQMHHTHLGNPLIDPDLQFFIEERVYEPCSRGRRFIRIVLLPLIGSRTWGYLRYLFKNRYKHVRKSISDNKNPTKSRNIRIDNASFSTFWTVVVAVSLYSGTWPYLIAFWIVPYLTFFHILGWFIEISEHTPLMVQEEVDIHMTRNRKSTGLEKFLTGIHNDHHHLDHHLDPRTPFWHLPAARRVRLRDATYAAIDRNTGGLFTRGPNGAPSAVGRILRNRDVLNAAAS